MLFSGLTIISRNTINVLANANDQLVFEHDLLPIQELTDTLKVLIKNENNDPRFPEKKEEVIELIGKFKVSKAVVSIANDKGTSYKFYIQVQNEVERAYNELRKELAMKHFNTPYDLLKEDQKKAVDKAYPKRISEAEPR